MASVVRKTWKGSAHLGCCHILCVTKTIHFYSWCYLMISPKHQGDVTYFSCSIWWNEGFFSVSCIYVTLILQQVWTGGGRRIFRPILWIWKWQVWKGRSETFFEVEMLMLLYTEQTFSIFVLVIFSIRGKNSANCIILQKACIFAYISAGESAIASSQTSFLSWNN